MSAAVSARIVVDTLDAAAKTLPATATPVHFADLFCVSAQADLIACCVAADNGANRLPLDEYTRGNSFTPGSHVRMSDALCDRTPEFVVEVDGQLVGGWRGKVYADGVTGTSFRHTKVWIVGLAEGLVDCSECGDGLHFPEQVSEDHTRFVCRPCADRLARMDGES